MLHYDFAIGLQTSAEAGASLPVANGKYQFKYARASRLSLLLSLKTVLTARPARFRAQPATTAPSMRVAE